MKNKYQCPNCRLIFSAAGTKIEYQDPIYGRCWKRVADCPGCGGEAGEYWPKSAAKANVDFDSFVGGLKNQGGGCGPACACD